MDIKTLRYYLAVVREGTILGASEVLNIAQPSLSRHMKELEEELNVPLFQRGNRKITLTEEGMILRKRAEEMLNLLQITKDEISLNRENISGIINIGAGESKAFHIMSKTASAIYEEYPNIRFNIISGDSQDLTDKLNNGLIDFAVVFSDIDQTLYHSMILQICDRYGVLMPKDHELADRTEIDLTVLRRYPVIISRSQATDLSDTPEYAKLNIVATYNLIYNASLLVEDGLGLALGFEGLVNTSCNSDLTFVPLTPEYKVQGKLIWKKYQLLAQASRLFLDRVRSDLQQ